MSAIGRLWSELRRRHVFKAGGVYAVAAFIVLQLGEIVLPAFGTPAWGLQSLVICAFLGLPVVLCFAWAYDLAPGARLRRTSSAGGEDAGPVAPRLALLAVTAGSATLAAFWLGRTLIPQAPDPDAEASAPGLHGGQTSDAASFARLDPDEPVTALAVLPLADLAEGDDLFARQLHDEIVNELVRTTTLRVASRASAERYAGTPMTLPEIARDLRVQAVVTGSVAMTAGSDSVRISVQLLHAASDTHLLAKTFQREMKDVLRLQTEVAAEIAAAVRGEVEEDAGQRVAETEGTAGAGARPRRVAAVSPAAIRAYFRGRDALRRSRPRAHEALDHFAAALAADSSFAGAWAGLAEAGLVAMLEAGQNGEDVRETVGEVADALRRAEELGGDAEDLAAARVVLAGLAGDPVAADANPRIALHVRDFTWLGRLAAARREEREPGGPAEAPGDARRVRSDGDAWHMAEAGRYDSAAALFRTILATDSVRRSAWRGLEEMHLLLGNYAHAAETRARAALAARDGATPPEQRARTIRHAFVPSDPASYWHARKSDNELREAHGEHVAQLEWAQTALGLGDEDEALRRLESAVAEGEPVLGTLRGNPLWDPLRDRPEFRALADRARQRWTALGRGELGRRPQPPPK